MDEKPLYEDNLLKIDYNPRATDEHILFVKQNNEEKISYFIQRGVLADFAKTRRGALEIRIDTYQPMMLYHIKDEGIGVDGLHVALLHAHMEEEKRIRAFKL